MASSRSVFVGNLPYQAGEREISDLFSSIGNVVGVRIVTDRETGRPKGFGFCEFESEDLAKEAVNQLNGTDFMGRSIRVDYANSR